MKNTRTILILILLSCIIGYLFGRATTPETARPNRKNPPSNIRINSKEKYRELEKEIISLRQQLKKAADNTRKIKPITSKENPSSFNPSLLDSLLITNNKTRRVKETAEQLRDLFMKGSKIKQMVIEKIKKNPEDDWEVEVDEHFVNLHFTEMLDNFTAEGLNKLGLSRLTGKKFQSLFNSHMLNLEDMYTKKPFNAEEVTELLTTIYSSRLQLNPANLHLMKAYIFETAQALESANIPPAWLLHEYDRRSIEAEVVDDLLNANKSLKEIALTKKKELLDRLYHTKEFYITHDNATFNSAFELVDAFDGSKMHECRSMNSLMNLLLK